MNNSVASLVFALQSNRGAYALLVGSGVSSGAGVPTGHGIMLDLVRRLAVSTGAVADADPEAWYKETFGTEPSYSKVLTALARTPAERQAILRQYFEPSENEKAEGLKVPGEAHHAIARLVAKAYIRVIVTTNFDRLLERAMEAEGISPVVASSPEQVQGLAPLAHQQMLILKVHGDYLDARIRNSPEELSAFESSLDTRLDELFATFGLIVCGWSAEHDVALRRAIDRCTSRQYTTFWTARGAGLTEEALQVARRRDATIVPISDADSFFKGVADSLEAVERFGSTDTYSLNVAVARAKRYLSEPRYSIELEDLLMREANDVNESIASLPVISYSPTTLDEAVLTRVPLCEAVTLRLATLFACTSYHGRDEHLGTVLRALRTAAPEPAYSQYRDEWVVLRDYPGMLLFYAAGAAAVAAEKHDIYCRLLCAGKLPQQTEAAEFVNRWHAEMVHNHDHAAINQQGLTKLPPEKHFKTPLSSRAYTALAPVLRSVCGDDKRGEEAFDRWELLVSLLRAHYLKRDGKGRYVSIGQFSWRVSAPTKEPWCDVFNREIRELGAAWPPFQNGLFGVQAAAVLEMIEDARSLNRRLPY